MTLLVYLPFMCINNNTMVVKLKVVTRKATTIAIFSIQLLYKENKGSEIETKKVKKIRKLMRLYVLEQDKLNDII